MDWGWYCRCATVKSVFSDTQRGLRRGDGGVAARGLIKLDTGLRRYDERCYGIPIVSQIVPLSAPQ